MRITGQKVDWHCNRCKKEVHCLHPSGGSRFCFDCYCELSKMIFKDIGTERRVSVFEEKLIVPIYLFCHNHGIKCQFQWPIWINGCSWYQASLRDGTHFECPEDIDPDGCLDEECRFNFSYVKYYLDFALSYGELTLDLELDGVQFHKNRKGEDMMRDKYMRDNGYGVLRFDWRVVKEPEEMFHEILSYFCINLKQNEQATI